MARRPSAPQIPPSANLSAQQMQVAIPKLERRLGELEAVEINSWDDATKGELDGLQLRVEETLMEVFGEGTSDYERYRVHAFWYSVPMSMLSETPPYEWVDAYQKAIASAVGKLKVAISMLKERLDDLGVSSTGKALRAYEGLDLHPEIERHSGKLYRDGHYANAIENAVKALNGLVRLRSGIDDKDGASLMEFVFSPKKPVLKFNALADESDQNEQKGFMMLFSGAVAGLRNPRAHRLMEDDSERALEFIAFVSLLAKLLDGAST